MMNVLHFRLLLMTLLSGASLHSIAQQAMEAEDPGFNHTIGLNTVGLLNQFRSEDNEDRFQTPYLITYSLTLGKLVLRAGIGPEVTTETIIHDGFTNSEEHNFLRMDGRLGAGLVILDDGRWEAIAGVDAAGGYLRDQNIDDSGFDRITEQEEIETYGGGPFLQLAYNVSRRVSLSVESAAYWLHRQTTETLLFENFPDFNNIVRESSGSELELALPNTLFVRIHF